ncbi:RNA polymerase III subunit E, partial [Homo sapiens]
MELTFYCRRQTTPEQIDQIDVYLAKSLAEKLYLFQYPVRPASMTYDDIPHLSAKIKPKQQKVELEMAIDTLNPNYCRSKGEQIALNVDGACADETSTYSSKLMDKQTFCSSQTTSNTSRYAAALYRQGELHLTPLHGIL